MADDQQTISHKEETESAAQEQKSPPLAAPKTQSLPSSPTAESKPNTSGSGATGSSNQEQNGKPNTLPWFETPEWITVLIAALNTLIAILATLAVATQAVIMFYQTKYVRLTLDAIMHQAKIMTEQVVQTGNQTKVLIASVAAAKDSAKAANDQISMTKEKERARLSVKPPPSLPAFNVRQRSWSLTISLPVKNDGPTQAVSIACIAAAIASADSSFPKGDQDFVSLPSEIGGGEGFPVAVPLSHRFIGQAVPEHFYVHVWGGIEYRDIFDEKKIHSAPFGFRCEMKQIRGDGMAIQDGEWWDWGHPDQQTAT